MTVIFPTVQPVNVLGSLGVFSITIGFAFRDILENLLAGVLLLFRAPLRTWDEIEVRRVRDEVLRGVVLAYGSAGIEMPTDILQLEGSDSLATAVTRGAGGCRLTGRVSSSASAARSGTVSAVVVQSGCGVAVDRTGSGHALPVLLIGTRSGMPSQASGSTSPETGGSRRSWLLPAGTFLAGCALGAVVVGLGDVGSDDGPSPSAGTAADAEQGVSGDGAAGDGTADAGESGLYVRVPESCVLTADGATSLVEQVDRLVAAVADLEPERLRQTVDDVQQVREGVRDVAEQCRAAAAQRLQDAADAEGQDHPAPATPGS